MAAGVIVIFLLGFKKFTDYYIFLLMMNISVIIQQHGDTRSVPSCPICCSLKIVKTNSLKTPSRKATDITE